MFYFLFRPLGASVAAAVASFGVAVVAGLRQFGIE